MNRDALPWLIGCLLGAILFGAVYADRELGTPDWTRSSMVHEGPPRAFYLTRSTRGWLTGFHYPPLHRHRD